MIVEFLAAVRAKIGAAPGVVALAPSGLSKPDPWGSVNVLPVLELTGEAREREGGEIWDLDVVVAAERETEAAACALYTAIHDFLRSAQLTGGLDYTNRRVCAAMPKTEFAGQPKHNSTYTRDAGRVGGLWRFVVVNDLTRP